MAKRKYLSEQVAFESPMERETETQEPQNEPAFEELKNVESVQIVIQFSELDNEQKKRLLKVLQKL